MHDHEQQKFEKLFLQMQSCYPNTPPDRLRMAAYWEALKRFSFAAVQMGCVRAMSASQVLMPTAISIADHAKAVEKTNLAPAAQSHAITGNMAGALPPDNPFEQLARKWERENLAGKPDCSGRAAEILALLKGAKGPLAHDLAQDASWKQWESAER